MAWNPMSSTMRRRGRRLVRATALWLPRLTPFAGHKVPRRLAARRIHLVAQKLPLGVLDPGFERLVEEAFASELHPGNRVTLYTTGEEAFAGIYTAIDQARFEVLLESYILKDDEVGQRILHCLTAAAERGVKVRVLADAVGSGSTRQAFWDEMNRRGIDARLFHKFVPFLRHYLRRDHRKIIVVDRKIAFTGGMNIAEEYGSSRPTGGGTAWRDTHLRVEGSAATELAVVFREGWERALGEPFPIEAVALREGTDGKILVLDSRPERGHAETASVLAAATAATRRYLWLTNAYFAPGHVASRALRRAARRGVDVRLLLPGLTDVPIVRHAGHGYYKELLRDGVRIYEYQAAPLHAKTMVADDHVAVVGSSNLDYRSFGLNAECNLLILGGETATALAGAFRADLECAEEITLEEWEKRSWAHKLGDRCAKGVSALL